jgi:metallo-beta-lactamase family protein
MKITFNGAAQNVTGSQYLVEANGQRMLLECGLFQGRRAETYVLNRSFAFDFSVSKLNAVVLSHAHIDHSGNLPNLVKQGFAGPIYATDGTCRLADLMLRDAGHIQEADAEFINKKRAKRGEPLIEPLYTLVDAEQVNGHFQPRDYNREFEPIPGVTVHFVDAGHILGSAGVVLDVSENGRKFRVWFSGDIGRPHLPLLRDPVLPEAVEYLIMESTYGDKAHRDPEEAYVEFRDGLMRTFQRGGKVIIPAFAVGRTQELVYDINRMYTESSLPHVPVYVDSPLAVNATDIFTQFPQYFDDETNAFVRSGHHPALSFDQLHYVRDVEESKSLNDKKGPMVIISASGMAETGRILHHLKNNIENPNNTIMIVGWQSPETLGRRLADREKQVKIFGETYEVRADVATIGGLSAHAGQDILLRYANSSRSSLKDLYLVHGEPKGAMPLKALIEEGGSTPPVHYPKRFDWILI